MTGVSFNKQGIVMVVGKAYLIAICDEETNAIVGAAIWSSPEWEQSLNIKGCMTYVAYSSQVCLRPEDPPYKAFSKAAERLLSFLVMLYCFGGETWCRYRKLIPYLKEAFESFGVEPHPLMKFVDACKKEGCDVG